MPNEFQNAPTPAADPSAKPRRALPDVLAAFRVRARTLDADQRAEAALDLLLQETGAVGVGVNILNASRRVIAATDYPVTPDKVAGYLRHGHTLDLLLAESFLIDYAWDIGPNIAFTFPDSVLHNSPLYQFGYSTAGDRFMAFLCSPPKSDGTFHGLCLGRSDRNFTRRELRAFQMVAVEFGDAIADITRLHPLPLHQYSRETAVIEVDSTFRALTISHHAESILALYFGPCEQLPDGRFKLPGTLEAALREYWDYAGSEFPPGAHGVDYSFCHSCRGRRLSVIFGRHDQDRVRVSLLEDLGRLRTISRIRALCGKLPRDRYSTFVVCMGLMDGIHDTQALMKTAGIAALKRSSALKLISKARNLIEQEANPNF